MVDTPVPLPALQRTWVNQRSPAQAKIALFRSLFRGREDVSPRRFESRKTGRAGYSPACANEWVAGICEKPRIKCSECPHQRFLPVTDEVIRWHLSGRDGQARGFVMGVYPMLLDETCFFLAADFDKAAWQEDATAFLETCRQMNVPAALERSRSGHGGHLWFFFGEAIPATLARKLGAHLLTETMERRPDIGLDSYDRFFPNQDTLPPGGFGTMGWRKRVSGTGRSRRTPSTITRCPATCIPTATVSPRFRRNQGWFGVILRSLKQPDFCGLPGNDQPNHLFEKRSFQGSIIAFATL